MKIRVTNRLIISDPTSAIELYCEKELVLDNPDYYKRNRMGKYTGNIPSKIWLYEQMGNELWLPFGCLQDVWNIHPVKEDYIYEIQPIWALEYESGINLYPYQQKAVGGRALWLTHTQDLLNQSRDRASAVLDNVGLGTITAGKVNIGSHITFATVQTMAKLDLSEYKDKFDVIIVDEAQHAAGTPTKVTQFYKVISRLSARYKIGLTATPKRGDGLQKSMFKLLGRKLYEVTREEVAENTCSIKVRIEETGYEPDYNAVLQGDGTIDYNKLIDAMIHDEERLKYVMDVALNVDGPAMILANRVEYLERINSNLDKSVCLSGKGQSKKAKEERKTALAALNKGELDYICATYQLAAEGLDVPNLRYVIFATPEQNETTVIQAAGRVGRKADGKEYGTVVDLVDNFGMYYGWAKKRIGYYNKIGAEVMG